MLYADDILLVAPSVTSLQQLLNRPICEQELERLDMSLDAKKISTCIRIGPPFNAITVIIL